MFIVKKTTDQKKKKQPHRRTDCIMKLLECQCKKQKIKTGDLLLNILSVSHELTELIIISLCVHSSRNVPGQPRPLSAQADQNLLSELHSTTRHARFSFLLSKFSIYLKSISWPVATDANFKQVTNHHMSSLPVEETAVAGWTILHSQHTNTHTHIS